jgi:hypothetical protein
VTNADLAAALIGDGFDPRPAVGQDWQDQAVTWLPDGHRSIVRITSIGPTVSGWQARVVRRQAAADGRTVPSGDGAGVLYLETLIRHYRLVQAGMEATR